MKTVIQKQDDNLILAIPQAFADAFALHENAEVDITLVYGTLVIAPPTTHVWTLEELLAGITDENLHGETDF